MPDASPARYYRLFLSKLHQQVLKVEKELPLMMQTCMIKYNGIFILLEKSVIFAFLVMQVNSI
jgi:hypothetical protein